MSTLTAPARPKASTDDTVDHYYCCDEDESLCGLDLSDVPHIDHLPNLCVVCDDLVQATCPRCGQ